MLSDALAEGRSPDLSFHSKYKLLFYDNSSLTPERLK